MSSIITQKIFCVFHIMQYNRVMPTSMRQQIQAFIDEQNSATTAELSHKFHLSQAAIRYHLKTLLQLGEIETMQESRENRTRGHPARRYRVPVPNRPNELENLCKGLLSLLTAQDQGTIPPHLATQIAMILTDIHKPVSASPSQRIKRTLDYLVTHHYDPDWEARSHGPRIRFHNCPFATILHDFPGLCQVDQASLALLAGGSVVQVEKIDPAHLSPSSCIFDITPALPKAI
jgi:predicted ArsR family transcriptional regulator